LRKLQRESGDNVFVSERGAPFSVSGFRRMIERAGRAAGLEIKAHPHMLRAPLGSADARAQGRASRLQADGGGARQQKMGDRYLRKLLVVGATTVLHYAKGHNDSRLRSTRWIR
jgi:hypothetical protein